LLLKIRRFLIVLNPNTNIPPRQPHHHRTTMIEVFVTPLHFGITTAAPPPHHHDRSWLAVGLAGQCFNVLIR